jgi:hypothetical protein
LHASSIEFLERVPANVNSCNRLASVPAAACQFSTAKVGNRTPRVVLSRLGRFKLTIRAANGNALLDRCGQISRNGGQVNVSQCASDHQNWQPLGQCQKRSHDQSNKDNSTTNTGKISSLDHNQDLQRNAGYLSPPNGPNMPNKCTSCGV